MSQYSCDSSGLLRVGFVLEVPAVAALLGAQGPGAFRAGRARRFQGGAAGDDLLVDLPGVEVGAAQLDFTGGQLHQMIEIAGGLLSRTPRITVTLGEILYHPEAIMLAVKPAQALMPVRDAVQTATRTVTGKRPDSNPPRWLPHVTICYSTSAKPAAPIIAALGLQLLGREIQVSAVNLVIQNGPERLWDWHTIGTVRLPAPART